MPYQGLSVTTGQSLPNASRRPFLTHSAKSSRGLRDPAPHCASDVRGVDIRLRVQGLIARNNAQFAKSRNILRGNGFDVLNAMPPIICVIRFGCVFIRIERQPHGTVANGMGKDLDSALVELRHCPLVFGFVPTQRANLLGSSEYEPTSLPYATQSLHPDKISQPPPQANRRDTAVSPQQTAAIWSSVIVGGP